MKGQYEVDLVDITNNNDFNSSNNSYNGNLNSGTNIGESFPPEWDPHPNMKKKSDANICAGSKATSSSINFLKNSNSKIKISPSQNNLLEIIDNDFENTKEDIENQSKNNDKYILTVYGKDSPGILALLLNEIIRINAVLYDFSQLIIKNEFILFFVIQILDINLLKNIYDVVKSIKCSISFENMSSVDGEREREREKIFNNYVITIMKKTIEYEDLSEICCFIEKTYNCHIKSVVSLSDKRIIESATLSKSNSNNNSSNNLHSSSSNSLMSVGGSNNIDTAVEERERERQKEKEIYEKISNSYMNKYMRIDSIKKNIFKFLKKYRCECLEFYISLNENIYNINLLKTNLLGFSKFLSIDIAIQREDFMRRNKSILNTILIPFFVYRIMMNFIVSF